MRELWCRRSNDRQEARRRCSRDMHRRWWVDQLHPVQTTTRFDLFGKAAPFGTETANYPTLLLTGE